MFTRPNELFKGLAKKARTEGHATTESFKSIPDKDMEKIGNNLYQDYTQKEINPAKLQESVLFKILYFLYRHGCENLYSMRKDTFAVFTDASGCEFLAQKRDKLDKNHQADSTTPANQGKIYARPGEVPVGLETLVRKHWLANSFIPFLSQKFNLFR